MLRRVATAVPAGRWLCARQIDSKCGMIRVVGPMDNQTAKKRLLVIDDEPAFCRFVQSVGKLLNFDVQTTCSGKDIMMTEAPLPWDAIVLDIVMPDVDGIEIIRWLSKVDYHGRLLVVSGYAPNYARMACVLADASGSMEVDQHRNPISMEQLRAALS